MSGFAIFNIEVKKFRFKIVEGEWSYPRTVVIKFPSFQNALDWYNSDEYKPIKKIRLDNSVSNGIIIKGEYYDRKV